MENIYIEEKDYITFYKIKGLGKIRFKTRKDEEPWFCLMDICKLVGLNETFVIDDLYEVGISCDEVIVNGELRPKLFIDGMNLLKIIEIGELDNKYTIWEEVYTDFYYQINMDKYY